MSVFNPDFLAYLSYPPGLLLVSSNKCGSRFLNEFLVDKKGFKHLKIHDDSNNEILHNDAIYKKIFIYRDPVDRFIGWYNMFMYNPYVDYTNDYSQLYKGLFNTAFKLLSYKRDMIENIHHFLTFYNVEEIKELLHYDSHTVPLYQYFQYTNFSVDDYHILDLYSLTDFTLDKFGESKKAYPVKKVILNKKNIGLLHEIQDIISSVYDKDYELLSPKVKPYEF